MRTLFPLFLAAAASALAAANENLDGVALLRRANEAAGKLTAIAYQARIHADGALAARVPKLTGRVIARRGGPGRTDQLYIEASEDGVAGTQPRQFKAACDGAQAYYLEEAARSFLIGTISGLEKLPVGFLLPRRYFNDQPFENELRGAAIRHHGVSVLDGVECDVIGVQYDAQGANSAKLYLGKRDGLLRRQETSVALRTPGRPEIQTGTVIFDVKAIDVRPSLDERLFRLECPPGFRQEAMTATSGMQAAPAPAAGPPTYGSQAPDWSLKASDGTIVNLRDLRGKVVVLDFWATWCGPCRMGMPGMQKLHERFKGKPVEVFGANVWERSPNPMAFIKQKGFTYRQLLNADAVAAAYGVSGIPVIFVIGPDGKILDIIRGFVPQAEERIAHLIDKTLAAK